jgi:MacB-like periplasmic core domain
MAGFGCPPRLTLALLGHTAWTQYRWKKRDWVREDSERTPFPKKKGVSRTTPALMPLDYLQPEKRRLREIPPGDSVWIHFTDVSVDLARKNARRGTRTRVGISFGGTQSRTYVRRNEKQADVVARRLFGSTAILAEECRDQRQTGWLEDLLQDLRFGVRSFLRNPTFSVIAPLTLAICIGINAAFLMTAYAIAFKPLPYPAPDRLVSLEDVSGLGPVTAVRQMAKYVDYAGFSPNNEVTVQLSSDALRMQSATVTWNLLRVLGLAPYRGHWFDSQEEYPGRNRVVVLSQRTWHSRFGEDPGVVGRALLINDQEYEVIGIMPDRFAFPSPNTELWIPVSIDPRSIGEMWGGNNLTGIGRLHTGATISQAQAELRSLVDQVRRMFPGGPVST